MKLATSRIVRLLSAVGILLATSVRAEDKSFDAAVDNLLIAAQQICPVSDEALDSMGTPVKTTTGEQTIFLCCKECVGKPISKENWQTVLANLREAQGECPVLHKPLPKDAAAIVVNHRLIFVCCKMCISKVKADPDKYIAAVNDQMKKNLDKSKRQG